MRSSAGDPVAPMQLLLRLLLAALLLLLAAAAAATRGCRAEESPRSWAHEPSAVERALAEFGRYKRSFMDGFGNATELLQNGHGLDRAATSLVATGQGRGRRRKLKTRNRALMAVVLAYTLKFMFLIPTFLGTLALLKFTVGLAGFFYALFAAVLGLQHQHHG